MEMSGWTNPTGVRAKDLQFSKDNKWVWLEITEAILQTYLQHCRKAPRK